MEYLIIILAVTILYIVIPTKSLFFLYKGNCLHLLAALHVLTNKLKTLNT